MKYLKVTSQAESTRDAHGVPRISAEDADSVIPSPFPELA